MEIQIRDGNQYHENYLIELHSIEETLYICYSIV